MLVRKIPFFDTAVQPQVSLNEPSFLNEGAFCLSPFCFPKEKKEALLLSVGDALTLSFVHRRKTDDDETTAILRKDNCFYEKDEVWALLVSMTMRKRIEEETAVFYMALPICDYAPEDAVLSLYYDGVFIRFLVNGVSINDHATGYDLFVPQNDRVYISAGFDGLLLRKGELPMAYRELREEGSIDFYMPYGPFAFAGDVMNFYHDGTYHLMYLFDRRHHGSGNGRGAHYIAHVTTTDFETFYEQEPIVRLEAPYETCGTGTMLFHNGKYYMSYGLHSERYSEALCGLPALSEDGMRYAVREVSEVLEQGLVPAGATYAVSEDGIRFTRSGKLFHVSRNPSAYAEKDGTISLYAGYGGSSLHGAAALFRGTSFDAPFVFERKDMPPACTLPTRPTTECPSLFARNGYRYMIYGFTGYRRSLAPGEEEMVDAYSLGEEIYEGLGVPMVCEMNGRHIMAGWPRNAGWAAMIIHRELIDEENGRLGMKWMPELVPDTHNDSLWPTEENATEVDLDITENYLLSATVFPSDNGVVALKFLNQTGEGCEWRLDVAAASAQFADACEGLAPAIPSMQSLLEAADPTVSLYFKTEVKDLPAYSRNFSISHLPGLSKPFPLRALLRYSRKTQATYIDVEIGGRRTMISGRNGLRVSRLLMELKGGAQIKQIKLSRLKHAVE